MISISHDEGQEMSVVISVVVTSVDLDSMIDSLDVSKRLKSRQRWLGGRR
jgi:hypothetical protein